MVDGITGINRLFGQVNAPSIGARKDSGYNGPRYTEPQDRVTLSADGKKRGGKTSAGVKAQKELSTEEKQQVQELKKRDAEVKAHEQAHMAAGGGIVQGGASYQYQRGPDGKTYAVGGEVKIDVSPERTPEATIRKMQQVQSAALAPAQPSGTDRAVAARAAQIQAQASLEKTEESQKKAGTQDDPSATTSSQNISPNTGADEAESSVNGEPAGATAPNAGPAEAGAVNSSESAGVTQPNAGTTGPAVGQDLFSYKADLSPNSRSNANPKGLKIDLVA